MISGSDAEVAPERSSFDVADAAAASALDALRRRRPAISLATTCPKAMERMQRASAKRDRMVGEEKGVEGRGKECGKVLIVDCSRRTQKKKSFRKF